MPVKVIVDWEVRPGSIWACLAEKLGREPTRQEAADEVRRILREASETALVERATQGRLPHQRRR